MKNSITILLMALIPSLGFTQETDSTKAHFEIFTIVEEMPEFPGGREALTKFITENIVYPVVAAANNIQGTVYVNFVIGNDSVMRGLKVIRGIHELLDKEALRVMEAMPKWKPGSQRGKTVSVSYNLPIKFKLD